MWPCPIYLSTYLPICCLPICPSAYLPLSVCLSICCLHGAPLVACPGYSPGILQGIHLGMKDGRALGMGVEEGGREEEEGEEEYHGWGLPLLHLPYRGRNRT